VFPEVVVVQVWSCFVAHASDLFAGARLIGVNRF